jgi:hypothetical protein
MLIFTVSIAVLFFISNLVWMGPLRHAKNADLESVCNAERVSSGHVLQLSSVLGSAKATRLLVLNQYGFLKIGEGSRAPISFGGVINTVARRTEIGGLMYLEETTLPASIVINGEENCKPTT